MSEVCTQRLLVLNLWNEADVHDDKTFYSSRWTRCLHRWKAFQFKPCGSRLWGQSQDSEDWTLQKGFKIFSIKHPLTSIARELKYVGILTETAFEQCGWTERWVTSMIIFKNMIMIIMTRWRNIETMLVTWAHHILTQFSIPSAPGGLPGGVLVHPQYPGHEGDNPNPIPYSPIQSRSNPNPIRHPGDPHNPGHASKSFRPAFSLNRLLPLLLGVSWYVSNL